MKKWARSQSSIKACVITTVPTRSLSSLQAGDPPLKRDDELQSGNICIPCSSNEQHIIEDYDVWDFELTADEMARMTALEKDERFADY